MNSFNDLLQRYDSIILTEEMDGPSGSECFKECPSPGIPITNDSSDE